MTGVPKFKIGHVTLTPPIRGQFGIVRLTLDIFYLCAKFEDSGFNSSRDIIGALKFKVGQVTRTVSILKVICRRYVGLDIQTTCIKNLKL